MKFLFIYLHTRKEFSQLDFLVSSFFKVQRERERLNLIIIVQFGELFDPIG